MLDPKRDCIGLAEAVLLRKRIEDLEIWKSKYDSFQESFNEYKQDRITREIKLEGKLETMETNLTKIVQWQETQQLKPAKRWENIADKVLMMVVGAIVAFVLAQIGLS